MPLKNGKLMILKFETMQKKPKAVVQHTEPLINLGKSKRLAAMRQSVAMRVEREVLPKNSGVNKKEDEIQQARLAISLRIAEIKATYPQGRQNKLFALRYGSEEKIKQMGLQQLFTLLKVNQRVAKEIAETKFVDNKFAE